MACSFCGHDRLCSRFLLKSNYNIRSLDPRCVAQEISERDGFCDHVTSIRIVIYGFDAIAESGKRLFDARTSESGRLGAGDKITLLPTSRLCGHSLLRSRTALKEQGADPIPRAGSNTATARNARERYSHCSDPSACIEPNPTGVRDASAACGSSGLLGYVVLSEQVPSPGCGAPGSDGA